MKFVSLAGIVILAVVLQVALARYTVGGRWVFDLVLVGVVVAALQSGPIAGLIAGTIGGLLQDVLAGGIIGVGGLAKTLSGFGAGVVGAQFVVARPYARMIIVAVATVMHRLIVLGLYAVIDQEWRGVSWGAMLAETGINAMAGFVVFQAVHALPGALERQRMNRRSSLSRRQW